MKNLLRHLPDNPSKWLYSLFRRYYTFHLLDQLLTAQYPGIQMVFKGGQGTQLVVGYSDIHMFFVIHGNLLTYASRKDLINFSYDDYYHYKDKMVEWVASVDGQKILRGVVALLQAKSYQQFVVKLKGRKPVVLDGKKIADFSWLYLLQCRKHLYMLLFWDFTRCHAFLPHEMIIQHNAVPQPT